MESVLGAALEVQQALCSAGERYCFIGGIALLRWGEARFTRDVDVNLLAPFGDEARTSQRLLALFQPRMPDALEFAVHNRVLLLKTEGGIPIDVAFGAIPFEERCIARANDWILATQARLRTCTAEDLIVQKAFASRPQDWLDIASIHTRLGKHINWPQVFEELTPLAAVKEDTDVLERLRCVQQS